MDFEEFALVVGEHASVHCFVANRPVRLAQLHLAVAAFACSSPYPVEPDVVVVVVASTVVASVAAPD